MLHGVGPVQTDGALLEDVLQELGSSPSNYREGHKEEQYWDTDIIMRITDVSFLFPQKSDRIKDKLPAGQMCLQWEFEEKEWDRSRESSQ